MVDKAEAAPASSQPSQPVTIKKYANRRLYNTATSSYVTLDHLCQMVKDNTDFVVYDAKTGEDITRQVLTQIIVEEEGKGGQNLLPIGFLRQLISFYGDNMQFVVPRYLDYSMRWFASNQEQVRKYMTDAFGGLFPFGQLEEMGKQNMAMFERAMKMMMPFGGQGDTPPRPDATKPAAPPDAELTAMKTQLEQLQRQLDQLTRVNRPKS
ncbi:MAG: polyhydroxyalkanoate synthesis repressor PhaR [Alphaproteobacteria bacterium]|nr:polyhydroxyalkanoate synthesis repressor PhaR [Alphaproteobacteria bacterium]